MSKATDVFHLQRVRFIRTSSVRASVRLPVMISSEGISVCCKHGVLRVTDNE